MARRHAAVHGAAEGRLEAATADAGIGQRRPHGLHAERGEAPVGKATEGMQADTGDVDGRHARTGRKAYERTGRPSSSAYSVSTTSCIGRPGRRRAGSGSVSRETTERPPSSATTPKP